MTTSIKTLIQGTVVSTTPTVYYTAPANVYAKITQMLFNNNTTASVSITVYLCAGAGTPSRADIAIPSRTLVANEVWVPYPIIGAVLAPGGTIQIVANTANAIIAKASGLEIS